MAKESAETRKLRQAIEAMHAQMAGTEGLPSRYFTCTSCGQTFHGEHPPQNCPVCEAPSDKIKEV